MFIVLLVLFSELVVGERVKTKSEDEANMVHYSGVNQQTQSTQDTYKHLTLQQRRDQINKKLADMTEHYRKDSEEYHQLNEDIRNMEDENLEIWEEGRKEFERDMYVKVGEFHKALERIDRKLPRRQYRDMQNEVKKQLYEDVAEGFKTYYIAFDAAHGNAETGEKELAYLRSQFVKQAFLNWKMDKIFRQKKKRWLQNIASSPRRHSAHVA